MSFDCTSALNFASFDDLILNIFFTKSQHLMLVRSKVYGSGPFANTFLTQGSLKTTTHAFIDNISVQAGHASFNYGLHQLLPFQIDSATITAIQYYVNNS